MTAFAMESNVSIVSPVGAPRRRSFAAGFKSLRNVLAAGALCLMAAASTPAFAADLEVAVTGSDVTGNGSAAAPFATPAKAVIHAQSGDSVVLHNGTYPGGVWVRKPNITLRSATGEWAKIQSSTTDIKGPQCNNLWFLAPGGKVQSLELQGGGYYCLKFEAGNALVEDCKIHESGIGDAIKLVALCHNVTIRRCEIYSPGVATTGNCQGIDTVNSDHLLVQDCYVHDVPDYAIMSKGGAVGAIIERCLVQHCTGGILLGQSTDQNLFSPLNPKMYENINGTVRDCIVTDTKWCGIGLYATLNARVYNNTLVSVAQQAQGAIFLNYTDHYPGGVKVALGNTNAMIVNNIVAQVVPTSRPMVYLQPCSLVGGLNISNNCYYAPGKTAQFWDISQYPAHLGVTCNMAQWQARFKSETASMEKDPRLSATFHPSADSPCNNSGINFGTPRVADHSMGANWDAGTALFLHSHTAPAKSI